MKKILSAMAFGFFVSVISGESKPKNIADVDPNFKSAEIGSQAVNYFNAEKPPFELNGFPWRKPGGEFFRLPETFTENEVNNRALTVARHTSGGELRFRTDSPIIALRAELDTYYEMSHMARNSSAGFDLYCGSGKEIRYAKTAAPPRAPSQKLERLLISRSDGKMKDWTFYFPLYNGVKKIEVGLAPGSKLEAPTPHAIKDPVLFYGSSITQGGCAARTGNAYSTMLCRAVDAPQINLGFSGSGRGEEAIAEAVADLKLSALIMDYDHNAPSVEHLEKTHEKFFRIIRGKQPDLPVILLSRCDFSGTQDDVRRREIIRKTFENAIRSGDRNVWFIDGETLFGNEDRDACTIDGCHPNDLGFYRMYRVILPVLRQALKMN